MLCDINNWLSIYFPTFIQQHYCCSIKPVDKLPYGLYPIINFWPKVIYHLLDRCFGMRGAIWLLIWYYIDFGFSIINIIRGESWEKSVNQVYKTNNNYTILQVLPTYSCLIIQSLKHDIYLQMVYIYIQVYLKPIINSNCTDNWFDEHLI